MEISDRYSECNSRPGQSDLDLATAEPIEEAAEAATPANGAEDKATRQCEHCQQRFKPRAHSGGRPQRFCSPTCRAEFHAERSPPLKGESRAPAIEHPTLRPSISKPPVAESTDWNWFDHDNRDDIVVPGQPAVAVYFNPRGEVVIRQEGQYHPDEDHFVFIQVQNLGPLIEKLTLIARREIVPA